MGRDMVTFSVSASVSRHNSEQDKIDDELWDELQRRVREIIADPRYHSIGPLI